jgi:hypothetical protein
MTPWFALKNNEYSSRVQRSFPDDVPKKNTWMKKELVKYKETKKLT